MSEKIDVAALRDRVAELEALERARVRRTRRGLLLLAVVGVLGSVVATAANGNCPNGMPYCFQANQPASAASVNENFAQLREWIIEKTGAVDAGTVTANGGLTANGPVIASSTLSVAGGTNLGSDLTVGGNLHLSGSMLGAYQDNSAAGGSLPADGGAFAADAGFSVAQDYRASTDGFLVAFIYGVGDGPRCWSHLVVDGVTRATMSIHFWTPGETWVNDDSATVPVKKGSTWKVELTITAPVCKYVISWIPLAP